MEQRKARSRRQWQAIISQQQESGLSAKAFCQAQDIGLASFYQWRRRLQDEVIDAGREIDELDPKGEGESKGTFIDMGQVATSAAGGTPEHGAPVDGNRWTVTLDLGEGIMLTISRG